MESTMFDLARPFALDAEQCAKFRREGHILLQDVVTAEELAFLRPILMDLVEQHARTRIVQWGRQEAAPLLEYVGNVWQRNEEIREFVCAKRFARIAARLMGVAGVRLYHDEVIVKDPGGPPAPWHKDHYSWPLATHHMVKMWLALGEIRLEMGAIRFATGTHRAGQFPEVSPSYESNELFGRIIHDHRIPVVTYPMKAGDASFHLGGILHSTLGNESTDRREALAVIYFEDGARVMAPNHEHRRADLAEFLPGLGPGDTAATHLNPLLYSSTEED